MNKYFSFVTDKTENILVCYYSGLSFHFPDFSNQVLFWISRRPFVRHVVLITPRYNKNFVLAELEKSEAIKRLKESINAYKALSVHAAFALPNGLCECYDFPDDYLENAFKVEDILEDILVDGVADICKRNKLVMECSSDFHYVKPSGKHSSAFIKASNVLELGSEISFLAMKLLALVPDNAKYIFVDTSGIFSLMHEVMLMKTRLLEKTPDYTIDSFGSYKGAEDFMFYGGSESLVVISASTTNDLQNKLKLKAGLQQSKIISIFCSGEEGRVDCLVDFNVYRDTYGIDYFRAIDSQSAHDCTHCKYQLSIPLSLSNRQFVFEAPKSEYYLPVAVDSPKILRDLISDYQKFNAYRCLYDGIGGGSSGPDPEFFIDVSLIVNTDPFQSRVAAFVNRNFPLAVDTILYLNDSGAKELAECVAGLVRGKISEIKLVSLSEYETEPSQSGVLVVAASMETGKSLLNVSRLLRKNKDLPITYLVGFSKYNDYPSYEKLKKDLVYSNGKNGHHQYYELHSIMLPLTEQRAHSWGREKDLLKVMLGSPDMLEETKVVLNQRLDQLNSAASKSVCGLGRELFLKSHNGFHMQLSPNFAFWNSSYNKDFYEYQATVYFTIASMIQGLRRRRTDKHDRLPLKEGYVVKRLDPLLFDRFNEGIIHASILRSAKSSELDYSNDDYASKVVVSLIERMFLNLSATESESLSEFLLALCTFRLQVKLDHFKSIPDMGESLSEQDYPLLFQLLKRLKIMLIKKSGNEVFDYDQARF
jgi:hypothetical protein